MKFNITPFFLEKLEKDLLRLKNTSEPLNEEEKTNLIWALEVVVNHLKNQDDLKNSETINKS